MSATSTFAVLPSTTMVLIDAGISPERVLCRAGLPVDLLARGPIRLLAAQYYALWEAAEQEAGVDLALLVGRLFRVEAFDPVLFAVLCCSNLSAAAARIARFKPLVAPLKIDLGSSSGSMTVTIRWPDGLEPPASLAFAELMFWVSLARLATRTFVTPLRVTAPSVPPDPAAYRAFFGAEAEAGADWAVTFSSHDCSRPFLTANDEMWRFFEPDLRRRLAELDANSTTTERLRAALLEALPAGEATVPALSHRLGLSTRTLQRRLGEEGTAFQRVVSETRESLALHYLQRSQLPAAEISYLLGYQDQNSFYRAFRAWTGTTPDSKRAAAGATAHA